MRTYILHRLFLCVPTLLVITFLSYALMRMAPGDPVKARNLGGDGVQEFKESQGMSKAASLFRQRYHLDKSIPEGYALWLWGIVSKGDFGSSITVSLGKPVWELIRERLPATIKLNLWSEALVFLIAVPAGIYSAVRRRSVLDRSMSFTFFLLYSLPSFWTGLMLIIFASTYFPSWPTSQLSSRLAEGCSYWQVLWDTFKHYVLPVACLSYGGLATLSRFARVGLLEVLKQDYVRTAKAKGCTPARIVLVHALRNGLIPIIVIMAGLLPGLIGGSIIVEYLFEIEGMGDLMLTAIGSRDYPVIMTVLGLSSLLVLVGMLISDIALALADPRISYEAKT